MSVGVSTVPGAIEASNGEAMRVLLQRVTEASVRIDGEQVGQIGGGLLLLIGVTHTDTKKEADFLVDKCVNLRVFDDDNGVMNRSLLETGGAILAVSQFTLYGDARKGRRPAYVAAAPGPVSEPLYNYFVEGLKARGVHVETGRFGADMAVSLINDGPVTLMLEKDAE